MLAEVVAVALLILSMTDEGGPPVTPYAVPVFWEAPAFVHVLARFSESGASLGAGSAHLALQRGPRCPLARRRLFDLVHVRLLPAVLHLRACVGAITPAGHFGQ